MKQSKKVLTRVLTLSMCAGMLVGCGNGAKNGDLNGLENAGDEKGRKPLNISITQEANQGVKDSKVEEEFQKLMSEKLGREVNITYNLIAGSEYSEKASLMFATGDLGDITQIPFMFDCSKAAEEGMLLDLSQYKDQFNNYFEYMDKTSAGIAAVTDSKGAIYQIASLGYPRFPEDSGMLPSNVSTYRYDIFEANNIKIPETLDELYDAAKQLKGLYPDTYPINTRWKDLRSLFAANHTQNDIYWNGEEYVMGLFDEGYKDAIDFAHKLYAEGLLDPEYITDDDDMLKSKEMTDKTFIVMGDWFTTPGEFTRLSTSGQVFCATLFPSNPKYGDKAWQSIQDVNRLARDIFSSYCVNANTDDPEGVIEFMNHLYDDDVVRLLTWGIEGESYNLDADGNPVFVDEILNATDPWSAADAYGMRASKNMRPGLMLLSDSLAFVGLAADDWLYYKGELHQEPIEQSSYYRDELPAPTDPTNQYVPPYFTEPILTFTDEESQENSQIITIFQTIRDEQQAKFVSGERDMVEWDDYMQELKAACDIDKLLENYNAAVQRYFDTVADAK